MASPKLLIPFFANRSLISAMDFSNYGNNYESKLLFRKLTSPARKMTRKLGLGTSTTKKEVVILGTGWGAFNFLKNVDRDRYNITVVSPRNFFVFTPLLPSAVSGTLSLRSCILPLRSRQFHGGKEGITFSEAYAESIDLANKEVICENRSKHRFKTPYDYLIVSVGSEINTFNTPGAKEHAFFLKEAEGARRIRQRLMENFEEASLPSTPQEKREQLLHFVVVGGGPTGVETAAEIADFIREDAIRFFPKVAHIAKVSVVEMQNRLLPTYTPEASRATEKNLINQNIRVLLQTKVLKLTDGSVLVEDLSNNEKSELHCRFTLWASGVQNVPFTRTLINAIPSQQGNRVLKVNQKLQVVGADPYVYAIGDCAFVQPEKLSEHAEFLYEVAKESNQGAGLKWIMKNKSLLSLRFASLMFMGKHFKGPAKCSSFSEFKNLLEEIDRLYKPPFQTAQHATQEGKYLAAVFNAALTNDKKKNAACFIHKNKGAMAYIGANQSIIQSDYINMFGGAFSNLIWRTFYWMEQFSLLNRLFCLSDWSRTKISGRDAEHERINFTKPVDLPRTN